MPQKKPMKKEAEPDTPNTAPLKIATKPTVALGLMSGTSLDGVDAAFLETDGERIMRFGPRLLIPYSKEDKRALESATQAALRWQFKGTPPNSFAHVEALIFQTHARAVKALCEAAPDWAARLEIIGFHGQTVLHHPATPTQTGRTLQLGDGQALADRFQCPVAYDFRQADVAAGGQGAPLAPIYHKGLATYSDLVYPVAILNLGGVGNVTLLTETEISASDTGPGNGPLDQWMLQTLGQDYDADGALSLSGIPDFRKISNWLKRDFFQRSAPRSADRYDFDVLSDMGRLSAKDGAATLAAFTAEAVKKTVEDLIGNRSVSLTSLIVCGGGRHNRAMLWMLKERFGLPILTAEDVGWDSDAIEAQAFGYLAVRTLRGLPISFPRTTGVNIPLTGGKVAFPRS